MRVGENRNDILWSSDSKRHSMAREKCRGSVIDWDILVEIKEKLCQSCFLLHDALLTKNWIFNLNC